MRSNKAHAGGVRSRDGTITSFDPPFCVAPPCPPEVAPQSINDEGVITGSRFLGSGGTVGWVRFP
jgi:hypothetical protein